MKRIGTGATTPHIYFFFCRGGCQGSWKRILCILGEGLLKRAVSLCRSSSGKSMFLIIWQNLFLIKCLNSSRNWKLWRLFMKEKCDTAPSNEDTRYYGVTYNPVLLYEKFSQSSRGTSLWVGGTKPLPPQRSPGKNSYYCRDLKPRINKSYAIKANVRRG